jgi:hypothetical protein
MISERDDNSKRHLADTQDDSHLHLEGVGEGKSVIGKAPRLNGSNPPSNEDMEDSLVA